MAARPFEAVILDAEGDVIGICSDQTAVRNREPMSVSRQICQ
ncbi:MAG: hypothetical protein ACI9ND_002230, partial [Yoonia sp.]